MTDFKFTDNYPGDSPLNHVVAFGCRPYGILRVGEIGKVGGDEIGCVCRSLVASLVVPFLDLAGRRKLLILSTVVCSGSLVTLGLVYYPFSHTVNSGGKTTSPDASESVVPVATASTSHESNAVTFAIQAFLVAGYSAGLGPVPWILAVELTPLRGSGMELGSVYAASWAAFFVTANYFSTSSTMHWLAITLWVYSCLTLTSGLLFLALLPESAHASIEDVLLVGQEVKYHHKDSIRHTAKTQEQASKQDVEAVPRPAPQPTNAVAAPPGHSIKAAPPKRQKRPSVAASRSSAMSRSRCSEAFRRAHGHGQPEKAVLGRSTSVAPMHEGRNPGSRVGS
ncbi:hypothetical protein HPB52_018937 [Rhipicephalus sanguineus]|uniref:Sugar transporter n=1 Tax=Rhipicephalus sanguineus TaxID=34632 RepID=A0A9D4PXF9_RHISA|nr:hypothetical protein HPB52_018937 [Rhipicephalus sanguineus]